ncbi:hypothetical protein CVT26_002588 [Gymnopilus dilepis]|uniref:Uncharacterized protein n=1 Tax=Gymnopilus dilepis TaxID=231916 RepID=A0A409VF43_9AGAR|nr:hypothetical protein CVT26_002588 [Gymnopilus dilepis]
MRTLSLILSVALTGLLRTFVSGLPVENGGPALQPPIERDEVDGLQGSSNFSGRDMSAEDILRLRQGLAVAMLRKLHELQDSSSGVIRQSSHPLIPVPGPEDTSTTRYVIVMKMPLKTMSH